MILFLVTCSFQHGLRTSQDITPLSFWANTFTSKLKFSFQILWISDIWWYFFCKMEKCPLVSYFYFWAKPFLFWAKRCGRNSLWAKLAISKRIIGFRLSIGIFWSQNFNLYKKLKLKYTQRKRQKGKRLLLTLWTKSTTQKNFEISKKPTAEKRNGRPRNINGT